MYYTLLKQFLFRMDPERAHGLTLKMLRLAYRYNLIKEFITIPELPCDLMGLHFRNPLGLAAGLDKNGDYIDALAALGFGFIEVGTVTRQPQVGNPKPRLFRLPHQQAIINRMGFNNKGVEYLIKRLKKTKYQGVLGINIGKNRDTPLEKAVDDYLYLFRRVIPYASYVTINISSPNTEGLRDLQHGELLQNLLHALKEEQNIQHDLQKKYVPLVVKIAPDLSESELTRMGSLFLKEKIDAVIAGNTTLSREGVEESSFANEKGGLSGKPLTARATQVVNHLYHILKDEIPIIACGGIFSAADVQEKMKAGAKLVQVYTGFIYQGPGMIETCLE